MNINITTHVGVGLGAAGIGFGAGYLIAKRKFKAIADEEILSVKAAYHRKLEEKPPIELLAKELRERAEDELELKTEVVEAEQIAAQAGYIPGENVPEGSFMPLTEDGPTTYVSPHNLQPGDKTYLPETDPVEEALQENFEDGKRNIFDSESDQAAFERNAEAPYLVSQDSWGAPEYDFFEKMALVYYSGDNTLTTEDDKPIEAIEELVGQKNLTMFGPQSQSGDDLILYVRNEQTKTDYEILLRKTSYQLYILTEHPDEE